ncbi:MAG TPA: SOS response-associated peptidase [Myxococcales bacterium]|nr:SOS response-associated peptidase [Myxococcales bacterium]
MCGRMVLTRTAHELGEIFDAEPEAPDCELGPRYNVAPSQDVLALRGGSGGGRVLARLHWGLIPSWARERAVGYRMINARSETAAEKPSFRKALGARRCIVPADGFYEWQSPSEEDPRIGNRPKGKPTKIPHFFRNPAGRTLAIAGLWESWTDSGTGEVVESCTLLTTEANDDVRPVHHRMPVFLDAKDYAAWLDPDLSDIEPLQALMVPAPVGLLEATRVSVWVNNPRNEDARCIEAAP